MYFFNTGVYLFFYKQGFFLERQYISLIDFLTKVWKMLF